jgi:hypothetical protein
VTLSATSITQPRCRVELPEGARGSACGERDTDEEEEEEEQEQEVEEQKIEGREVSAPSPTAQEQQDSAPVVNGDTTDIEGMAECVLTFALYGLNGSSYFTFTILNESKVL